MSEDAIRAMLAKWLPNDLIAKVFDFARESATFHDYRRGKGVKPMHRIFVQTKESTRRRLR